MFGSVFILAIGYLMTGVIRFWREISPGTPRSAEIAEASHNALTLKYLDGGTVRAVTKPMMPSR
nr:TcuB [Raoultella sp. NCTC 9187]